MEFFLELLKGGVAPGIVIAILAILGIIYIYRDGRTERVARQLVMDKQNAQWLNLYKENLEETSKVREEMGKTREVISELKGVISSLNEIVLKKLI